MQDIIIIVLFVVTILLVAAMWIKIHHLGAILRRMMHVSGGTAIQGSLAGYPNIAESTKDKFRHHQEHIRILVENERLLDNGTPAEYVQRLQSGARVDKTALTKWAIRLLENNFYIASTQRRGISLLDRFIVIIEVKNWLAKMSSAASDSEDKEIIANVLPDVLANWRCNTYNVNTVTPMFTEDWQIHELQEETRATIDEVMVPLSDGSEMFIYGFLKKAKEGSIPLEKSQIAQWIMDVMNYAIHNRYQADSPSHRHGIICNIIPILDDLFIDITNGDSAKYRELQHVLMDIVTADDTDVALHLRDNTLEDISQSARTYVESMSASQHARTLARAA